MYATRNPSSTMLNLAAAQSDVISRRQILDLGGSDAMLRRFVRDGHWYRIAAGIVSTTDSPNLLGWVWQGCCWEDRRPSWVARLQHICTESAPSPR